jgi:chromate reductase, NAD(P)H dehydrogenase (quinone)
MTLARHLRNQLQGLGFESALVDVVRLELPMYDSEKEARDGIPDAVEPLKLRMLKAEGYLIVAPEYNGSIPPVLTNLIAWISRSGSDYRQLFSGRFIQLATHSGSGGHDLMQAMRMQFAKLGAVVSPPADHDDTGAAAAFPEQRTDPAAVCRLVPQLRLVRAVPPAESYKDDERRRRTPCYRRRQAHRVVRMQQTDPHGNHPRDQKLYAPHKG